MVAFVQVDVTEAWHHLDEDGLSPTAFVLACVGRAVSMHPDVHAYKDWLGRLVVHPTVGVATMVEVDTPTGSFPLAHLMRDADTRTVTDLSEELRRVSRDPATAAEGVSLMRWGTIVGRIPGLATAMFMAARRSTVLRRRFGTVTLSSVGMMIDGNGFAFGLPTVASITVIVGGASQRPWIVDDTIRPRTILDLSVSIDHRIVDGGPAGRFGATLRQLLEHPELIAW